MNFRDKMIEEYLNIFGVSKSNSATARAALVVIMNKHAENMIDAFAKSANTN